LEASPGGASSGYVSNIEGVLKRFEEVIQTLQRDAEEDVLAKCAELLEELGRVKTGESRLELLLLDPLGHSQILHEEAVTRELSEEEASALDSGPMVPVFDSSDLA